MDIAFFTHYFPKLSESFIINQVAGLMERGHDVTVFASERPDEDLQHDIVSEYDMVENTVYTANPESYSEGVEVLLRSVKDLGVSHPTHISHLTDSLRLGKSAPTYLANLTSFLDYGERFDVCHAHFGNVGRKWSFVSDLPGQGPLVTTFYGMDVSGFVHPDRYTWYEPFWPKCDLAIGISQYIRAQMITLGCPEERSIRHPIGIDVERFEFDPTAFTGNGSLRIASVARHAEQKGLKYGIEAVANCLDRGIDVQFTVAGDGELRPQLESRIRELGVEENVTLLGWQTQEAVRDLLADSHLFMLPSVTASDGNTEGQALVLQEAQAMGLPVISTYHNGIPEGVDEGRTGLLVPERDVEKLTESIEYFYRNPSEVDEFGHEAARYVENNYANELLVDEQVSIYEEIVG